MSKSLTTPGKRWLLLAGIGLGAALFIALFAAFDPTQHNFFPQCWLHQATGLHCPGCGTQRSIHALFTGDLPGAFGHNMLLMLILPVFAWRGLQNLSSRVRGLPPRLPRSFDNRVLWTFFGALILFGVLRNLPVEPLTYLAP